MARQPVRINVYDMYWLNGYSSNIGVGIFHTGVEVYGVEYAYGGHPFPFSGVFENTPQDAEELGENFRFKESILVGETDFTQKDLRQLIKAIGDDFRGDRYHLISRNCNHFTQHLVKVLTGGTIPGWINRLASISGSIPFLERMLPQEWLTPVALQHSIDDRRNSTGSVENAEEAREAAARLNDSRTTVLNGRSANGHYINGNASSSPWASPLIGSGSTTGYKKEEQPTTSTTTSKEPESEPKTAREIDNSLQPERTTKQSNSAPATARSSSPAPVLFRLWNQLKDSFNDPDEQR